jgi:hypothetical protein
MRLLASLQPVGADFGIGEPWSKQRCSRFYDLHEQLCIRGEIFLPIKLAEPRTEVAPKIAEAFSAVSTIEDQAGPLSR